MKFARWIIFALLVMAPAIASAQDVGLDDRLALIEDMLERRQRGGLAAQLDAIKPETPTTPSQKAHVLFLKGFLAELETTRDLDQARAIYLNVVRLYGDAPAAAKALYRLGLLQQTLGETEDARASWEQIRTRFAKTPTADRATVALEWLMHKDKTPEQKYANLSPLADRLSAGPALPELFLTLASLRRQIARGPSAEEVDWLTRLFENYPDAPQASEAWEKLREIPEQIPTVPAMKRMLERLPTIEEKLGARRSRFSILRIRVMTALAVLEEDLTKVRQQLAETRKAIDLLRALEDLAFQKDLLNGLEAETYLIEAARFARRGQNLQALPALTTAIETYRRMAVRGDSAGVDYLFRIARLMEHMREWEAAIDLYRKIYLILPTHPRSEEALARIPKIYDDKLANPMEALAAYRAYAAAFPPPDALERSGVLERIHQLGYSSVIEFQNAVGVKADGLYGEETTKALADMEELYHSFKMPRTPEPEARTGAYVHDAMMNIAKRLQSQGRLREAIHAYEEFLHLFPTKRYADDALYNIGWIFQDSYLFEEAATAYRQLMSDYPKGEMTGDAYLRAAECLENLGRWTEADDIYALYLKNFPSRSKAAEVSARRGVLARVQRYQEFLNSNPPEGKLADGYYEMGSILYKERKNYYRAALAFQEVANRFPKHYHAPEAQFMLGTIYLHTYNFPRAREAFQKLVREFSESRLADDGQFWTGHSYEYEARALGELDRKRISIKKRSLDIQIQIYQDVEMRRRYLPPGTEIKSAVPDPFWVSDGLSLKVMSSVRDRTKSLLGEAIAAYRKTADQFKTGDMADRALARVGAIYIDYLEEKEKGVEAYRQLLEQYPGSQEAVDAQFQVGAYYQKEGKFAEAIKAYELFLRHFPNDARVEQVMINIADGLAKQKDWVKSIDAYESYLNKFPAGPHAAYAKDQINWIKKYYF